MNIILEVKILLVQDDMTTELLSVLTENTRIISWCNNFTILIEYAITHKTKKKIENLNTNNSRIILIEILVSIDRIKITSTSIYNLHGKPSRIIS